MSQVSRIVVKDREKWSKECLLEGQIVYIGSHPSNGVYLKGASNKIAQRHLMVRPSTVNPYGHSLFNLSSSNIHHYSAGQNRRNDDVEIIRPNDTLELAHGHKVIFDDYELFYYVGAQNSAQFEVRIELKSTVLKPETPLAGHIVIHHTGDQPAVQFEVVVEGLPPDFVEIEAGPVLFPGVAKEVAFELTHPKAPYPPAGRQYPVRFHVTAQEAYPTERATLMQMIEIAPYQAHVLRVVDFSSTLSQ